jgi:hypothetical protein
VAGCRATTGRSLEAGFSTILYTGFTAINLVGAEAALVLVRRATDRFARRTGFLRVILTTLRATAFFLAAGFLVFPTFFTRDLTLVFAVDFEVDFDFFFNLDFCFTFFLITMTHILAPS